MSGEAEYLRALVSELESKLIAQEAVIKSSASNEDSHETASLRDKLAAAKAELLPARGRQV